MLTILPNLKSEKWQLVRGDFSTPIKNIPTMPLTLVQKQWLKAVLLDPRAALFDLKIEHCEFNHWNKICVILKIEKNIKSKIDIHIYASRVHVNIIHKTVNKKNALEKLFYLEDLDFNDLYVIGDNDNDYEMLKRFKGGVITNHHKILDELNKKEFDSLHEFIEYVEK